MENKNNSILISLVAIFLLVFIFITILFHNYTEKYALIEANKLAQNLLLTHKAIHKYIDTVSRPELYRLKDEGLLDNNYFSPKTMSITYAARGIHDFLNEEQVKEGITKTYFKLASNSPRSELNRADEYESHLLKLMNEGALKDYREIIKDKEHNKILYIAIPTKPIDIGCLKCHGDPDDAPVEMVELYPDAAGYYEEVGNIRALISIRIPLKKYMEDGNKISNTFILITFIAFLLIYILIWYFIHRINQQHLVIISNNLKLEHMATHDVLTGLPNRRYFKDYAENQISHGQRKNEKVAFLYIDLDGFKIVNDNISHQAGDFVLQTVATRFMKFIRKNEFISRIGGDEFCMIIYGYLDLEELENTAKRLIQECTEVILIDDMEIDIGMSIGIAIYPDNGLSYDELMSVADETMYRIKKNTKGSYGFF